MAHFYATLRGTRGNASRIGTKRSGIEATVASWHGAVSVQLWHAEATDTDMAEVSLVPWHGAGQTVPIYAGPVSGATLRAIGPDGRCGGCKHAFSQCGCVRVEG